jgi:hypothetical protein
VMLLIWAGAPSCMNQVFRQISSYSGKLCSKNIGKHYYHWIYWGKMLMTAFLSGANCTLCVYAIQKCLLWTFSVPLWNMIHNWSYQYVHIHSKAIKNAPVAWRWHPWLKHIAINTHTVYHSEL